MATYPYNVPSVIVQAVKKVVQNSTVLAVKFIVYEYFRLYSICVSIKVSLKVEYIVSHLITTMIKEEVMDCT